jgi:hypothetical protein
MQVAAHDPLGGIFKRMLGGKQQPARRVADADVVLVFMVGGLCLEELRQVIHIRFKPICVSAAGCIARARHNRQVLFHRLQCAQASAEDLAPGTQLVIAAGTSLVAPPDIVRQLASV